MCGYKNNTELSNILDVEIILVIYLYTKITNLHPNKYKVY